MQSTSRGYLGTDQSSFRRSVMEWQTCAPNRISATVNIRRNTAMSKKVFLRLNLYLLIILEVIVLLQDKIK